MSSISPDELAAPFGVDSKELDKPCTEAFFSSIADLVHPWRLVFAYLLCKTDLDDVDRDSHSQPEKRFSCLRKWRSRSGDGATFRAIIAAVLSTGNVENAQALCRIISTKLSHDQPLAVQPAAVTPSTVNSVQPSQSKIAMIRLNEEKIIALFTALVMSVQATVATKSDVKDVRHYLMRIFCCSLPDTTDLDELFTTVSLEKLWDYQHHSPLESVATHFLPGNQEIEKSIKEYKAHLTGFYVMTKLVDFMECKNLSVDDFDDEPDDQPPPLFTSKQCKRLTVVLKLDRRISELSLEYVHKLWCSFAEEYNIPSLTAVLERVATGSLEITWIIPLHFSDKIVPRSKFFRRHGIVQVSLDDVILYNEEDMADYEASFLELCYNSDTADIDQASFFLEQGVDPDVYDVHGEYPLFYAIYNGREDLVKLLIQYHADVDLALRTENGEFPLVTAICRGNYQMVELLLNNNVNVNKKNKKGKSPLYIAAYIGHRDIVQLLLDHHANVDLPSDDDFGETALIAAVRRGHYEVVDILLRYGANANLRSKKRLSPLLRAARSGRKDIIQLLLDHHANVDLLNDDDIGGTALITAVRRGHYEVVVILLRHCANVNLRNKKGLSPLWRAAFDGRKDIVQLLLDSHANVNLPNDDDIGGTALIAAVRRGHYEVVDILLRHDANANLKNKTGVSPLGFAVFDGYKGIVQLLLDHHANVDLPNDDDIGETALIAAVRRGHYEVVVILLRHGANANLRNKKGLSPLHFAARDGHRDIVQLLLDHHANVDLPDDDEDGLTPLSTACERGHLEVATVLVKNGADINYVDKRGVTPLGCASLYGRTEMVDFLLSKGADIDKGQTSPLYVASAHGRIETVQSLVSHCIKIDKRCDDKYGATPLIVACGENHLEVVKFLTDHGADINLQTKGGGFSPLHFASQNGCTAVVNLLVHSGAQVEMKNKEGRTALMLASWRGYLETVKELLRAGARTDTQDQKGPTALILATQKGHMKVVKALLDAKADPNTTENTEGWSAVFFAAKSGRLDVLQCLINGGARVDIRDKNGQTPSEVTECDDIRQELESHSLSQSEPEATDERTVHCQDIEKRGYSNRERRHNVILITCSTLV